MPTPESPSTRKPGENLVVTQGGVRVDGDVHTTQESADAAAAALRKRALNEKSGSPAAPVAVKQQING